MDKIHKLIKLLYILTFAVYGILAAFVMSWGLLTVTTGFFWIFVFDNPWPRYSTGWLAPAIVRGMCVLGGVAGIFWGRQYAGRILEKNSNANYVY